MQDAEKSKTKKKERSAGSQLKFPCCNFENMAAMMREFCGSGEGSFDCCAMMEKMCGTDQKKSRQQ